MRAMTSAPPTEKIAPPSFLISASCLFFLAFWVFSDSTEYGFLDWDDEIFIHGNPLIRSLDPHGLWQMLVSYHGPNWQPLTWFSFAINYHYFDLWPLAYHFTNVVIHSANVTWVFILFCIVIKCAIPEKRYGRGVWLGGIAAALFFGLHPLRVESVAWISERKDVLYAFFYLPGLIAYLHYGSAVGKGQRRLFYTLTLFCFMLSLLSKEMAVTFPAVLLLLDIFPLNRWQTLKQSWSLFREKIPFFLLSLGLACITIFGQGNAHAVVPLGSMPLDVRIVNAVKSLGFYLQKTLWPTGLVPYYPFSKFSQVADSRFYLTAVILLLIGLFCWRQWQRGHRLWGVALLYYLITASPVIGIIQVGAQAAADRYSYLTTLSVALLFGAGVFFWRALLPGNSRKQAMLPPILVVIIVTSIAMMTFGQLKIWSNTVSLWSEVIKQYPNKVYSAHLNIGKAYVLIGDWDSAEREFKIAAKYFGSQSGSHSNLGTLYYGKGRDEEAFREFSMALRIDPQNAIAHKNLGSLYYRQGKLDLAEKEFKLAIKHKPLFALAHNDLGVIYFDREEWDKAEQEFREALAIDSGVVLSQENLARIYLKKGWKDKAEKEFAQAGVMGKYIGALEIDTEKRLKEALSD